MRGSRSRTLVVIVSLIAWGAGLALFGVPRFAVLNPSEWPILGLLAGMPVVTAFLLWAEFRLRPRRGPFWLGLGLVAIVLSALLCIYLIAWADTWAIVAVLLVYAGSHSAAVGLTRGTDESQANLGKADESGDAGIVVVEITELLRDDDPGLRPPVKSHEKEGR